VARISRVVVPGYPHHITQRGVRSMAIFRTDEDRRDYLQFLSEETRRFGVEILVWCLMTNHVHFIAVPQRGDSLARAFGEGHRKYTRMRNFSEGVRGYLFQGRFNSCSLDERHLLAAAVYVELNPVRVGIVKNAWEYRWSSAAFHTGRKNTDPLVEDRTLMGLVDNWKNCLIQARGEKDERIRRMTRTGRPAGGASFLGVVEQVTGRDLSIKKPGRPSKQKKLISIMSPDKHKKINNIDLTVL
jgi:putative transposase